MKLFIIKTLRNLILSLFIGLVFFGALFSTSFIKVKTVFAEDCDYVGQCVNNKKCVCPVDVAYCYKGEAVPQNSGADCGSAVIGGVEPPQAVAALNAESGSDIGLVFFASRVLNFANIIAGILVMLNFVYSGFLYITGAGNASEMGKINERMSWSFFGILLIIGSYTLAAIFGLVFYNNPTFIITPTLTGAGQ